MMTNDYLRIFLIKIKKEKIKNNCNYYACLVAT